MCEHQVGSSEFDLEQLGGVPLKMTDIKIGS